jgi:hypothetical protein
MKNTTQELALTLPLEFPLRPPEVVMDIDRLGSMHQSRLSFMRELVRKLMREQWQINPTVFELDDQGFGTIVYTIDTPTQRYSYVLFSNYLADEDRNDRVIADKWDVTMALCIGDVDQQHLDDLRENVPLQELGRYNSSVMVLSRGNKSARNFNYVVEQLAGGKQPDVSWLVKVGYLYRTTAVYGSGKFGMADWQKIKTACPEFSSPFSAEMFNCFMLRHFSVVQAEHLARVKAPETAISLSPEIKRYFGIGNSTGLGMAPFLIRHPKLISQWILSRENAIANVVNLGEASEANLGTLIKIIAKARTHILETTVPDEDQQSRNKVLSVELETLGQWLESSNYTSLNTNWLALVEHVFKTASLETQELLNSLLLELQPELNEFSYCDVNEAICIAPESRVIDVKNLIESNYGWVLDIDFKKQDANHFFWYRSEEKMEPRLGQRFSEPGAEKEMPLTIARMVSNCYELLCEQSDHDTVADIAIKAPSLYGLVTRIQTMSDEYYGEIRANLSDIDMKPMDLLRCKLSFFGVSKFDPKSKLWVRNTMFQGAPVVDDIGKPFNDDWYFPIAPDCEA